MPRERSPRARAQLGVASTAVMLAAADTYVVVLTLTTMIGDIGIPIDQLQRAAPVVSGFLLGYVAMLPLLGRLSDLHGRRAVLVGCLALFATGSVITASAHDLGAMVTGRTLQGVGGGGLVPVTLALVADLWPEGRRGLPLGAVGAAQEIGGVVGPLYGAAIVTISGWRTIFWVNLPAAAALAGAFALLHRRPPGRSPAPQSGRFDVPGAILAAVATTAGAAAVIAPPALVDSFTLGALFTPLAGDWAISSPVALLALGATAGLIAWELTGAGPFRRLLPLRRLPVVLDEIDWLGSLLLAGALGILVIVFAAADPSAAPISPAAGLLLPLAAALAALFVRRERRCRHPLIPPGALSSRAARGALATNVAGGAALVAALVDVPIFARETAAHDSQLGAALVLLRLLAAIPIGALAGGIVGERLGHRVTAAAGMLLAASMFVLMGSWSDTTMGGAFLGASWLHPSDPPLVLCGLGFGLTIAPVNGAILAAVTAAQHGLASALVVVARSAGMLVGLGVLTVIGLHAFHMAAAQLPSPLHLCPGTPARCPAYDSRLTAAVIAELRVIFAGAAVLAAAAAIIAAAALPGRRSRAGDSL